MVLRARPRALPQNWGLIPFPQPTKTEGALEAGRVAAPINAAGRWSSSPNEPGFVGPAVDPRLRTRVVALRVGRVPEATARFRPWPDPPSGTACR